MITLCFPVSKIVNIVVSFIACLKKALKLVYKTNCFCKFINCCLVILQFFAGIYVFKLSFLPLVCLVPCESEKSDEYLKKFKSFSLFSLYLLYLLFSFLCFLIIFLIVFSLFSLFLFYFL